MTSNQILFLLYAAPPFLVLLIGFFTIIFSTNRHTKFRSSVMIGITIGMVASIMLMYFIANYICGNRNCGHPVIMWAIPVFSGWLISAIMQNIIYLRTDEGRKENAKNKDFERGNHWG